MDRLKREWMLLVRPYDLPVRISHWVMAASISVLMITGYLIGDPPFSQPGDATDLFLLGLIRYMHFVAAYFLTAAFILRLYWGFVGSEESRWSAFIPWGRKFWRHVFLEIYDLLWPRRPWHLYIGHFPIAKFAYVAVYLAVVFSIVSGFVMYASAQYSPMWRFVAEWGLKLFGDNLNWARQLHHWLLWFFAVFVIIHVYLVVYTAARATTSAVASMIGGYKLLREEELAEGELEEVGQR
ncbi:MAG: Ni/Fe-hydrogenase, b-type cytochrome subunit [Thermotogae bacterium]|nr:Ni/Fe-hydrogenase, b-type cytochrome subunit [Thermotogota bacterium]